MTKDKVDEMVERFIWKWCIGLMGPLDDETEKMKADLEKIINEVRKEKNDEEKN